MDIRMSVTANLNVMGLMKLDPSNVLVKLYFIKLLSQCFYKNSKHAFVRSYLIS